MPSNYKRHTCQLCKSKRVEYLMFMLRSKSMHNGKPEWVCKSCPGAKDTSRSEDTLGSVPSKILDMSCPIDRLFLRRTIPLPSIQEQKEEHFKRTGIRL